MVDSYIKPKTRPLGLTMVELVAALGMFTLIVGSLASIFILTMRTVQRNLATQQAFDNMRYSLEYMARSIRQAAPPDSDNPDNIEIGDYTDSGCTSGSASCIKFNRPDVGTALDKTVQFKLCTDTTDQARCIPGAIAEVFNYCETNPSIICNRGQGNEMCGTGQCSGPNSPSSDRITPQDIIVDSLNFQLSEINDTSQPRVTIATKFHAVGCVGSSCSINLQTTVALRRLRN